MNGDATPPPPLSEDHGRVLKRKGLSKGCKAALIATVIMLGGMGTVGVVGTFLVQKGRSLQAKAVMKSIEIAIKGFQTEYLRLPGANPVTPMPDNPAYDTTSVEGRALFDMLLPVNLQQNPRHIRFWEPPPAKPSGVGFSAATGLMDPWGGQGYRVVLDYSRDGLIDNPEGGSPIKADVILYSAGPDGDFSTWKDNVRSWK